MTLEEIWDVTEKETGIPRILGIKAEWEWEKKSCFANPYMLKVVEELQKMGKTIVATSDMYLGQKRIQELLTLCGYPILKGYFVSCEEEKSCLLYTSLCDRTSDCSGHLVLV